eukprot:GHRQ01016543.1.p1 GENE.GHRQ01016543.1~~GHRQ01016543.1.p1  ORF type:complete len:181 (+),score=28.01 GHRQ01016543.1:414-956(+)
MRAGESAGIHSCKLLLPTLLTSVPRMVLTASDTASAACLCTAAASQAGAAACAATAGTGAAAASAASAALLNGDCGTLLAEARLLDVSALAALLLIRRLLSAARPCASLIAQLAGDTAPLCKPPELEREAARRVCGDRVGLPVRRTVRPELAGVSCLPCASMSASSVWAGLTRSCGVRPA